MKMTPADLYAGCEKMLSEKWGYIWGAAGVAWTRERQRNVSDANAKKYGSRWIGHTVADCSGVMVYIWKQHGLRIHHGSNGIARKHVGEMQKTPVPGYAAFRHRARDTEKYPDGRGDYYHIGIVAADGQSVYEAKGTRQGFVMSAAGGWDVFAPFLDVEYAPSGKVGADPGAAGWAGQTLPDSPADSLLKAEIAAQPCLWGEEEEKGGETVIWCAMVTTKSGSLNVRSGPGTQHLKVGSLCRGDLVDVREEAEAAPDWVRIIGGGTAGYVFRRYLTPAKSLWGVYMLCATEEEAKALAEGRGGARVFPPVKNEKGED